jgi:hypothetical protein
VRAFAPQIVDAAWGGGTISATQDIGTSAVMPAISLLFATGERPSAAAIAKHARTKGGFSVSLDPAAQGSATQGQGTSACWCELVVNGLTFDLVGLAPGPAGGEPPRGHGYDLPAGIDPERLEAIALRPGPHLAGGATMLPAVRSLASLGAGLAALPRARAVVWHAARNWCSPGRFSDAILRWSDDGVFPALGLAALVIMHDGGMRSEGMALFAGQELRIEPELAEDLAANTRLGMRLLHWLYEHGRLSGREVIRGPGGERLRLEPSPNGRFIRVWKG